MFLLAACGNERKLNDIMENEESFSGVVQEVNKETILVKVNEQDYLLEVSLAVELKNNETDFAVGDEVTVYYDGKVTRSYPGQVNTVYAIILTSEVAE